MADRMDKAIEEFKKVIAIEPSARSYALLGLSYQRLGRFDEAKQYFQEGLKLDPHNSAAYLISVLSQSGREIPRARKRCFSRLCA